MSLWHYGIALFVLHIMAAFFAGGETALTTASRARLHQLAQEGNRRAKLAYHIREKKEKLISTMLVGNTLVNSAVASVGTVMMTEVFGGDSGLGALVATLVLATSLLIFSEVLPKTFAIHYATAASIAIAPLLRIVLWLLSPVTWGVIRAVKGLMILIGANPEEVTMTGNVEELRGAIDLHRGEDVEVAEERAMLRSILDLNEVDVKSIMIHRRQVETIDADLPIGELVERVSQSGFTRMPVWREEPDNIIGVLNAKTLLREVVRLRGDVEKLDLDRVLTKPWFIPESTDLLEQLRAFRDRREHFAVVVDEYGVLQGTVTLEDILEEIVGDIGDEHDDHAMPGVIRQPNGSFLVEGSVTLRELNRQFEWGLPEDDAATIAGLVLHEARRVPEAGQTFEFHGCRFEILRRHRNQITQLRIWPPHAGAKD